MVANVYFYLYIIVLWVFFVKTKNINQYLLFNHLNIVNIYDKEM